MMLVLPVQTFASATMLGCVFSHQGPGMALQMALTESPEAQPTCHTPTKPDAKPVQHDCKHCSACYLASALPVPPVIPLPPMLVSAGRMVPQVPLFFVGFIPDSPERPPRAAFA